jgi:hypothetical protein
MNSTYAAGVLALLSCAEHVVLYATRCRVTVRLLAHLVVPDLHRDLLHQLVYLEQGVTKRCRLSRLTNSTLVYEPKCVSANENS